MFNYVHVVKHVVLLTLNACMLQIYTPYCMNISRFIMVWVIYRLWKAFLQWRTFCIYTCRHRNRKSHFTRVNLRNLKINLLFGWQFLTSIPCMYKQHIFRHMSNTVRYPRTISLNIHVDQMRSMMISEYDSIRLMCENYTLCNEGNHCAFTLECVPP